MQLHKDQSIRKREQVLYTHGLRNSMNELNTLLNKKYVSFYSRKGPLFVVGLRNRWRDIYSESGLLLPISSSGSQGVPTLEPPCKLVRVASDWLRVPRSTAILYTQSKSDLVVLITWYPSGYTAVVLECPDCAVIFLFTNQNVTACARGHQEWTENPCHKLYNTRRGYYRSFLATITRVKRQLWKLEKKKNPVRLL